MEMLSHPPYTHGVFVLCTLEPDPDPTASE